MTTQPEALRLADALGNLEATGYSSDSVSLTDRSEAIADAAADELRRLSKLVMDMQGEIYALGMARSMEKKMAELSFNALEKHCDALLEFAKYVEAIDPGNPAPLFEKARAAIKAVEGEKT